MSHASNLSFTVVDRQSKVASDSRLRVHPVSTRKFSLTGPRHPCTTCTTDLPHCTLPATSGQPVKACYFALVNTLTGFTTRSRVLSVRVDGLPAQTVSLDCSIMPTLWSETLDSCECGVILFWTTPLVPIRRCFLLYMSAPMTAQKHIRTSELANKYQYFRHMDHINHILVSMYHVIELFCVEIV